MGLGPEAAALTDDMAGVPMEQMERTDDAEPPSRPVSGNGVGTQGSFLGSVKQVRERNGEAGESSMAWVIDV